LQVLHICSNSIRKQKTGGSFLTERALSQREDARAREVDWEEAAVMGLIETDGRGQRVSCTRKGTKSLRLLPLIEFELGGAS
jgi:hypothetical protein